MTQTTVDNVLKMLRKLPPEEQLKVIAQALPEIEKDLSSKRRPRKSLLGVFANQGPVPSEEEIDEMRQEAWKGFPHEDVL